MTRGEEPVPESWPESQIRVDPFALMTVLESNSILEEFDEYMTISSLKFFYDSVNLILD